MTHRFLLDNDGSNLFYNLTDDVERDIQDAVHECPAEVTTYLLCAGAGTFYYPTRVGEVAPNAAPLLAAHQRGMDPFGLILRALRRAGKEVFITYRMNDVHNPDAPDQWNTSRFKREHPEAIVDAEAVREGRADWMCYCLDYAARGRAGLCPGHDARTGRSVRQRGADRRHPTGLDALSPAPVRHTGPSVGQA